jgi:ATP-dependent RNA helicase DeaD
MRQILREFGIEADWRPVPSADEVRGVLRERVRAGLAETIDAAGEPGAERLELARHLLDGRDPARVVAALLASAAPAIHAQPHDVAEVRSHVRSNERKMENARGVLHAVARQHVAYDDRRPPRRNREQRPADGEFERVTINWGTLGGANPKRILAHVCRRGGVTSQAVGAISMHPHSSTFDIRRHAAGAFELRARKRDARDPKLVVQRLAGVGA